MAILISIDCITGLSPDARRMLRRHNIQYAQQLQAMLETKPLRDPLLAKLGMSPADGRTLRDELKRLCPSWCRFGGPSRTRRYRLGLLQHPSRQRFGSPLAMRERPPHPTPVYGLPPSLSHVPALPDVRDQGYRGSCVAFGFTALREFMTEDCPPLSEQHLYYLCKEHDGAPGPGTYLETAAECLEQFGQCEAEIWPYNPEDDPSDEGQGPPPDEATENALKYRVLEYESMATSGVEEIKSMLYQGVDGQPRLAAIGVPVYESWFNAFTEMHGIINMPYDGDLLLGYHCLAVVGYHDDPTIPGGGAFIVRNSWSTDWSSAGHPEGLYPPGYGFIPYDYIRELNIVTMALTKAVALRRSWRLVRWVPLAAAILLTAISVYSWPQATLTNEASASTGTARIEETAPGVISPVDAWLAQYGGAPEDGAGEYIDWYNRAFESYMRNLRELDHR
jgi:hypothetical protein